MKKLLPNIKKTSGFTLVELLVVVSIIAILAVIGLTIFSNLQQGARDARRLADVEAIANAMEVNYSAASGQYIALAAAHFAGGSVPVDPSTGTTNCGSLATSTCRYCVKGAPSYTAGACGPSEQIAGPGFPIAGPRYTICTNLEAAPVAGQWYSCKASQR